MPQAVVFSEVKFVDVEPINPLFSTCKVYVMYSGENRNNSYISKESVEKAIPTIFNIPIIGEFIKHKDDFGGHGGKIEITSDGIEFIKTTMPYGVVPESATWGWETIDDKEYLVLDGCYLWTGRYDEALKVIETGKSQSMEIDVIDGNFNKKTKVYEINDFVFSALCILGDDVEPCFEDASIVPSDSNTFSLKDKEEFKGQLKVMMEQLQFSLQIRQEKELNNTMDSNSFTLTSEQLEDQLKRELGQVKYYDEYWDWEFKRYGFVDYFLTQDVVIAMDYQAGTLVGFPFTVNGDSVEVDFTTGTPYKVEYVPMDIPSGEEDPLEDFKLANAYKEHFESIKEKFSMVQAGNENSSENSNPDSGVPENFSTCTCEGECTCGQTSTDSTDTENSTTVEEYAVQLAKMQEHIDSLSSELESLREFKIQKDAESEAELAEQRQMAEAELFNRFANSLTEEDITSIKENASQMSLEEIEHELYALAGKKLFTANAKVNFSASQTNTNKVAVFSNETPKTSSPYGDLFDKFGSKKSN